MGFPRKEYWSRLPFPPPGHLPNQGSNPGLLHFLHFQADSLPLSHLGSLYTGWYHQEPITWACLSKYVRRLQWPGILKSKQLFCIEDYRQVTLQSSLVFWGNHRSGPSLVMISVKRPCPRKIYKRIFSFLCNLQWRALGPSWRERNTITTLQPRRVPVWPEPWPSPLQWTGLHWAVRGLGTTATPCGSHRNHSASGLCFPSSLPACLKAGPAPDAGTDQGLPALLLIKAGEDSSCSLPCSHISPSLPSLACPVLIDAHNHLRGTYPYCLISADIVVQGLTIFPKSHTPNKWQCRDSHQVWLQDAHSFCTLQSLSQPTSEARIYKAS